MRALEAGIAWGEAGCFFAHATYFRRNRRAVPLARRGSRPVGRPLTLRPRQTEREGVPHDTKGMAASPGTAGDVLLVQGFFQDAALEWSAIHLQQ